MRTWTLLVAGTAMMSLVSTACTGVPSTRVAADPGPTAVLRTSPSTSTEETEPRKKETGTDAWQVTRPAHDGQIAAYATAVSGRAGTKVGLKVSTPAESYRVAVYRIGAYDGGTATLVERLPWRAGSVQPAAVLDPVATRTVVAPWRRSLVLDTTGWQPGFHVIKLETGRGFQTLVPYVVSSETADGHGRPGRSRDDLAGLQPLGRLQPVRRPRRRPRSYAVSFDRPWNLAPEPTTTARRRSRSSCGPRGSASRCRTSPTSTCTSRSRAGRCTRLRHDGARRVLDDLYAHRGAAGPRRRDQPGRLRRQHDVLAGPTRRHGHRPGPAAGGLSALGLARPDARRASR